MLIKAIQVLLFLLLSTIVNAQNQKGLASYYATKFEGRRCASGEIFSNQKLTCAHKTLPFGTLLKVCNTKNKCVTVKVNDRLPKKSKRIIDLTTKAANQIDLNNAGILKVTLEIVGRDSINVVPRKKQNSSHRTKKKRVRHKK